MFKCSNLVRWVRLLCKQFPVQVVVGVPAPTLVEFDRGIAWFFLAHKNTGSCIVDAVGAK